MNCLYEFIVLKYFCIIKLDRFYMKKKIIYEKKIISLKEYMIL